MQLRKKRKLRKYWPDCSAVCIRGGREYFDVLEAMIDSATSTIYVQVYIFANDATGQRVADALKRAAKRGVKVFLLVDYVGSAPLEDVFIAGMRQSGVEFRYFTPLVFSQVFSLGRRMHHKVVIVDGATALVGGLNIAEKYCGTESQPAWLDFAVTVTGPVCAEISAICESVWNRTLLLRQPHRPSIAVLDRAWKEKHMLVAVRDNDWTRGRNAISRSYAHAVQHAEHSITIVSGYFLPGRHLRKLLKGAAHRGVSVRVVLAGMSDVGLFAFASRYLHDWLLRHKIEVYEYQRSVLHGKAAVVDDVWTTIGSYNLHYLSDFNNLELNINVLGKKFAEQFRDVIDKVIEDDCVPITTATFPERRSIWLRLRNYGAYQIMRVLMLMLGFFTPRAKRYEKE